MRKRISGNADTAPHADLTVVFPAQPGGTRRAFLGLMAYLEPKGKGDNSMPGKQRPCPCAGAECCGTRAIWLKLYCLNPNLQ
jgi:hypothetical protein